MKDKTVTMSRELADLIEIVMSNNLRDGTPILKELRALLAAPAVERQDEPVAWAMQSGLDRCARNPKASHAVYGHNGENGWDVPLYAEQPAPVSVMDESIIRDSERYRFIRQGTGEANYICLSSVQADMDAAIDACLDKVKELNQ